MAKIDVTRGSGNVFADIGIENADEALLKAKIVSALRHAITERGLTQIAAAEMIGLAQPDLSKLLRGKTSGFGLERLIKFLRLLGNDVEINVRHVDQDNREGRLVVHVS